MLPFAQCLLVACFASLGVANELIDLIDQETGFVKAKELTNLTSFNLFILRPEQLSNFSGSQLAALALSKSENAALFEKPMLACAKTRQQNEFLKSLQGHRELPELVQQVLARTLPTWYPDYENQWKFEMFRKVLDIGSPVLAYMPRSFLFAMEMKQQQKFLYHLQQWSWTTSRPDEWSKKSLSVRRMWAAMLNFSDPTPLSKYSPQRLLFIDFILTGSTPDELEKLQLKSVHSQTPILNLPLDPMQVRAVFASTFSVSEGLRPSAEVLEKSLAMLTPMQIASFTGDGNLSRVAGEVFSNNDMISWASAAQLAHLLVAEANAGSSVWSLHTVSTVGKWIYTLPSLDLRKAAHVIQDLPEDKMRSILSSIDSSKLDCRQANILAGKQLFKQPLENTLGLQNNLLLAVASAKIIDRDILPQNVITHLLSNLPAKSTALFALFHKVNHLMDKSWVLNSMLNGEQEPERFANFMKLGDVKPIAWKLAETIKSSMHEKGWPDHFLRVVAHEIRSSNTTSVTEWANILVSNPKLIMGLACSDLAELGPSFGVPILTVLGQHIENTRQKYPKSLRKCALLPLMTYLKNRAEIQNVETDILLDTLQKAEIMSIGGYPLAHLPYSAIKNTKNWELIVQAIGRLTVTELLEVFVLPGSTPQLLSQIALRLEGEKQPAMSILDGLGNLFQFLPYTDILHKNLDKRAFELWLEGKDRRTDTALCVNRATRASLWYKMIVTTYGSPSNWSAGTVATLGGLLIAVPPTKLVQINPSAIEGAADQLDANLGYTPDFIRLCKRYLGADEGISFSASVRNLLEFVLKSANELAAKVVVKVEKKRRNDEPRLDNAPEILKKLNTTWIEKPVYHTYHARGKRETGSSEAHPIFRLPQAKFRQNSSMLMENAKAEMDTNEPAKKKLLCGALKMAKFAATAVLNDTYLKMLDAAGDFVECLPYLGSLDLSAVAVRETWEIISKKNISVDVRYIGHLASQVNIETLKAADLTDMDVVNSVGKHLQLWDLLDEAAELVLKANNHNLSADLAGNMGRLLCAKSIWEPKSLLTPSVFLEIYPALARTITSSSRCPPIDCLRWIINLAEEEEVFGAVAKWDADLVYLMGTVMAGILPEQVKDMAGSNSLEGLDHNAFMCMSSDSLKTFSEKHFNKLSPPALEVIFLNRYSDLSNHQRSMVRKALVSSSAHALLTSVNYASVELDSEDLEPSAAGLVPTSSLWLVFVTSVVLFTVFRFTV